MDFNWFQSPPIFSNNIEHLCAFFKADTVLKNYPNLKPLNGHFSHSRKAEYIAGRFCAIKALNSKGLKVNNILSNEDRTPIWPNGIRGSITHCKNFVSVAISLDESVKSIGLDCEFIVSKSLTKEMIDNVLFEEEKELIFGDLQEFITLTYSIKESFFKAVYPLTKEFFYFEHAEILEINPVDKTFKIKALRENEKRIVGDKAFKGKDFISEGIVHTGLEIIS